MIMITEIIIEAVNENIPEDEHPIANGFVNGMIDGAFLYGAALSILGFGVIISKKILKC